MSGTLSRQQPANLPMLRQNEGNDPILPLRRQMNRMFDDFFGGAMFPVASMLPAAATLATVVAPRVEVSETEKELQVTAELPGIDPKDVEITLADDVLTIRGEKQAQKQEDDKERDYHVTERTYGTFTRYLRLPFEADPGQIQASFKDGVLTLAIPKPEEARQKVHRIPLQANDASAGGQASTEQQASQQQAAE